MPRCICRTSVHFAWILSTKCSTTMSSFTTIRIDNDLSSCQSRISMRPADHKFSGWIDMILYIIIEKLYILFIFRLYARNENIYNIILNFLLHVLFGIKFIMLSGNNDRIYSNRLVFITVF